MSGKSNSWYYQVMGDVVGPVSLQNLQKTLAEENLGDDTLVRNGDDGEWVSALSLTGAPAQAPPLQQSAVPKAAGAASQIIEFSCPHCGRPMRVPRNAAGKNGTCKQCGNTVNVPQPTPVVGFGSPVGPVAPTINPQPTSPPAFVPAVKKRTQSSKLPMIALVIGLGIVVFGGSGWYLASLNHQGKEVSLKPGQEAPVPRVEQALREPQAAEGVPGDATVRKIVPVKFDIQGMRIGDPLTDDFAFSHCPAKDIGKPDITGIESIDLDGKEMYIHFQFDNFKLISVSLTFESSSFDSLVEAYSTKFGVAPHESESEPVKTRGGDSYTNVTVRWITDSGPFTISKFGDSVDRGHAQLHTPELRDYYKRKGIQETGAMRKKL